MADVMTDKRACGVGPAPTGSGEPDKQEARPCLLHPRLVRAQAPLTRAPGRALPSVARAAADAGFTGSFDGSAAFWQASGIVGVVLLLFFAACEARAIDVAGVARATPGDDGPTLPIESVLAERIPDGPRTELVSDMAVAFPVATPGLRQGKLTRQTRLPSVYAGWLTQPLAIVADDPASRRWLKQQADALGTLGASVLVARVASAERMRALRQRHGTLPMSPAFMPEFAQALRSVGAGVYPVVVLTDGTLTQDVRHLAAAPGASGAKGRS
jgi:integrating conjugative element protein (TIGR03765 family)